MSDGLDWRASGSCVSVGGEAFFPEENSSAKYTAAIKVCKGCPVKADCLELGMTDPIGVYGGMTPGGRRQLRAMRRRVA